MPTFRFYAAREDAAVLLTFMFGELGCRVFEAYSRYGEALKELSSTDEVLEAFPAAGPSRPDLILNVSACRWKRAISKSIHNIGPACPASPPYRFRTCR